MYPQADKLKSGNQQLVEKHFDLTSAKRLWEIQFVKSLKRLLLTMAITWADPDTIGRTSKGEHHINTQDARPIALPLLSHCLDRKRQNHSRGGKNEATRNH